MVTALVTELGKVRPICFARFYLNRAASELERGDRISAGCLMREAIQRYLTALCDHHCCLPGRDIDRTPAKLLRTLQKQNKLPECAYIWIKESIEVGNKLAHCHLIRTALVRTCIELLHFIIDHTTELVFPTREGGAV
jgi:hypothetical protein